MPVQDTLDALPFPLTGCDERCLTTPALRLWDAANGLRAARDRGGSDHTATVTHRASKGGVAPASSEVWAASFLVAVCFVISFLFYKFASPLE